MTVTAPGVDDEFIRDAMAGVPTDRAGLVEVGSFCAGVVTTAGSIRWADDRFAQLLGDPSALPECVDLIRGAVFAGRVVGIVPTHDRGVIAVSAEVAPVSLPWPLPPDGRAALMESGRRVLLLAFAPSRTASVMQGAAAAMGLAPRETDLVTALFETPNLKTAAQRAGMSVETAKDALARACRKAGVSGASELVGRLLDLSCGTPDASDAHLGAALGLTSSETAVAMSVARGESVETAARTLGLAPATVKSYRRSVFAKTQSVRDRDLRRLIAEAAQLQRLATAREIVLDTRVPGERLRVIGGADGRRIVLNDYGPASGAPLFVMHGYQTGRSLPPQLVAQLRRDRWRPLVVQRPGFGRTDPAAGDYLVTAFDDQIAVMDALAIDAAVFLARDGGVATAIELAARRADRFERGVLLNPRAPRDAPRPHWTGLRLAALAKALLAHPALLTVAGDAVRERTSSESIRALLQRFIGAAESDRQALESPEVVDHLIRDVQALLARSARGLVDELRLYSDGWRPPAALAAGPWVVAHGAELHAAPNRSPWDSLPGVVFTTLERGGLLAAYTHPEAVAGLLKPPSL